MQTPLKRSCSAPCTCNRLVTFSLVLTIVVGTVQRVSFTIRSVLLMKQNTSCDPFAMLNTLQRSFYGLLRTNVPPTHQSNRGLLPLFFKRKKIIAQQVQVAETVQHTRPLLFLFQSQGTRFFWHALSGKAPVGILPSKSQQQARCDKVDVEPSDVFISAFTHNH